MALFRQGAPADAVWIVLEGWVHLVRSEADQDRAHQVVLFTVTPTDALCGISALGLGPYTASGIAGAETGALRIPAIAFQDALLHEPRFAYELLRLCARRIQRIAEQYGAMAEPVPRRIIRAILRLHEQFGSTIPVTHRELAQMSWTTTESAIRSVRALKQSGCVTGTRGQLHVSDAAVLRHALHDAHHTPYGEHARYSRV